ncbi:MAG: 2Fe-2S iron-sulfur cluster binding domain-containing protein [Kordiimonadaceae bacterium]|nr:2Fe-2S iron-sulfur cluster binding domain-containing protein [Kordiimonadaceae bacterium]
MSNTFKITVSGSSSSTFTGAGDVPVLISMQQQPQHPIKIGCRGGGCGVCKVRIVSGQYHCSKMSRVHISEAEQKQGYALACCLYPESDLEVTTKISDLV